MAAYAVEDYVTANQNTRSAAAALLETYLETIDDAKTIRAIGIIAAGGEYIGYVIVDT